MKRFFWVTATCAAVAVASCNDVPQGQTCKNIPDGGCPLSYGVACDDPACMAAYACNPDGTWTLDHACPPGEGGALDAAQPDRVAPPLRDANVDAPPGAYGGAGCTELQPPDCSLGSALACPSNSCCGCEDLFVCSKGNWNLWGQCGDGGVISNR
jgi:hypothetical protein